MLNYEYKVRGSTGIIHDIRLIENNGEVSFKCSCRGSVNKNILCKHRIALLMGDLTDLVNMNEWCSQKFINVISLLNVNHQLDTFIELSGYRRAYYELRDLSRNIDILDDPQSIVVITVEDYEGLLNDYHFAMSSQVEGYAEHVFELTGNYIGSIKTRRGISKIKNLAEISFQSEQYPSTQKLYMSEVEYEEIPIKGFHYINVSVINKHPAYLGQTILKNFKDEAKKVAKFFAAI